MDASIFQDGFYIYPDGTMVPESDAIESLSTELDEKVKEEE